MKGYLKKFVTIGLALVLSVNTINFDVFAEETETISTTEEENNFENENESVDSDKETESSEENIEIVSEDTSTVQKESFNNANQQSDEKMESSDSSNQTELSEEESANETAEPEEDIILVEEESYSGKFKAYNDQLTGDIEIEDDPAFRESLPKLSPELARMALGIIYNDPDYKNKDLSGNSTYQLLNRGLLSF